MRFLRFCGFLVVLLIIVSCRGSTAPKRGRIAPRLQFLTPQAHAAVTGLVPLECTFPYPTDRALDIRLRPYLLKPTHLELRDDCVVSCYAWTIAS